MDSEEIEYCTCKIEHVSEISLTVIPIHTVCKKPIKNVFPHLKVNTSAPNMVRRQHPDDFTDTLGKTGRDIMHQYYYKNYSIERIASGLNVSEGRIEAFLKALVTDEYMQKKYDYKTILRAGNLSSGLQSFDKKTPMSKEENDYGENLPPGYLDRGWVCPEEM